MRPERHISHFTLELSTGESSADAVIGFGQSDPPGKNRKSMKELVILFEKPPLLPGFSLEEPRTHAHGIYKTITLGVGIDADDPTPGTPLLQD